MAYRKTGTLTATSPVTTLISSPRVFHKPLALILKKPLHPFVKLSCKELNKRRWLMVELRSPEWSPDVRLSEWVRVGGTWLQLMCCAVSRCRVLNFKRQRLDRRSEIGGRRWLHCNDKSRTRTTRKVFQSRGARRGLKRIMLREDYVKDKSIFELRKHTGVCTTYIAWGLYGKRTKDYPSPEGFVDV